MNQDKTECPCCDGTDDYRGELFTLIGSLPEGALITEAGLARLFERHPVSIKRAVERGELPPPIHLMKRPMWTVGAIRRHVEERLEVRAQEHKKALKTLGNHDRLSGN